MALGLTLLAGPTRALNRFVVFPDRPEELPAVRYATLSSGDCLRQLASRRVPFGVAGKSRTVDAPVTLEGPLRGVSFESVKGIDRSREVLDCRLLLALDDFSTLLTERGIAVVRYNSLYRRGSARAQGQRHLAGVAIDIVEFVKHDTTVLNVLDDFHGARVGSATCGEQAPAPRPGKATALRELVCAVDRARVFNLMLTPHYDRRHRNHFHFEVRRGIRWFLTQ